MNDKNYFGKRINKKSQIGTTLAWFVATIIIFFIIVLFLSACIIFSAQKKIVSGSDKIKLEKKNGDLASFEILLNFLDKKIIFDNEKTNIKNIIARGLDKEKRIFIKEKLKKELDKVAKESYGENACYLFDIEYPGFSSKTSLGNGFDVCSFTCTDERLEEYVDQYKTTDLLTKAISFDLYSEQGVIKTKFYIGGNC